jgi:hypothetical protein
MSTNSKTQEKKERSSDGGGTWMVMVPVVLLLIGLGIFSLKLIFKKKTGKRLTENNKTLDKLDYVKPLPKARNHIANDPSLADLTEEEREYIAEILEKTQLVNTNH